VCCAISRGGWILLRRLWPSDALRPRDCGRLIHECTHNLVFKKGRRRKPACCNWWRTSDRHSVGDSLSTLPPLHHNHQGDEDWTPISRAHSRRSSSGNSTPESALVAFSFWRQLRGHAIGRGSKLIDMWYVAKRDWCRFEFIGRGLWLGWTRLILTRCRGVFDRLPIGGARWIQEHYITHLGGQETFSY